MEEKIFNLLETMYADLISRMDHMETRLSGRIDSVENELKNNVATKQDIVRLENKMDINHKALYDGYKLTYEKLEAVEERVSNIEGKVEKQDVEIRVIRSVK